VSTLILPEIRLWRTTKKAQLLPRPSSHFPPENIWVALRAAKEKAAHADGNSEKSFILAQFYNRARTHFGASA
jgi:hypothetical protein